MSREVKTRRGFIKGIPLRRIDHIAAGLAWGGTFPLEAELPGHQQGARAVERPPEMRRTARSASLGHTSSVQSHGFQSEADFLGVYPAASAGGDWLQDQWPWTPDSEGAAGRVVG